MNSSGNQRIGRQRGSQRRASSSRRLQGDNDAWFRSSMVNRASSTDDRASFVSAARHVQEEEEDDARQQASSSEDDETSEHQLLMSNQKERESIKRIEETLQCSMTGRVSVISSGHVARLDLSRSHLSQRSWRTAIAELSSFARLKSIDVSQCNVTTVEIAGGEHLVKICLDWCQQLNAFSITAPNVRELQLNHCVALKHLPSSIGNLKMLQNLSLKNCGLLQLPKEIGLLTKLIHLDLSFNFDLTRLPHEIGSLQDLQELLLSNCGRLQSLPNSISMLEELVDLDIASCFALQNVPTPLPPKLKRVHLQHTTVQVANNVRLLEDTIANIRREEQILSTIDPRRRVIDSRGFAVKLFLNLNGCTRISPTVFELTRLRELHLEHGELVSELSYDEMGRLVNLEKLYMDGFVALQELPHSVTALPLRELELFGLTKLQQVPLVPSLASMSLQNLPMVQQVEIAPNLKSLHLIDLPKLREIAAAHHGEPIQLESLTLEACDKLNLQNLRLMPFLRQLSMRRNSNLTRLPDVFALLTKLETLVMEDCTKLRDISTVLHLPKLTFLRLRNCTFLGVAAQEIGEQSLSLLALDDGTRDFDFYGRLNRSRVRYFVQNPTDERLWPCVLAKVSNDPSILYYTLRSSPSLFVEQE